MESSEIEKWSTNYKKKGKKKRKDDRSKEPTKTNWIADTQKYIHLVLHRFCFSCLSFHAVEAEINAKQTDFLSLVEQQPMSSSNSAFLHQHKKQQQQKKCYLVFKPKVFIIFFSLFVWLWFLGKKVNNNKGTIQILVLCVREGEIKYERNFSVINGRSKHEL